MKCRFVRWPLLVALFASLAPSAAAENSGNEAANEFPSELVHWMPRRTNPVFTAEGPGHWDVKIRERGWILRDGDAYHLWFTGYDGTREGIKRLGYATSQDGLHWARFAHNPLRPDQWIEDMMVVRHGGRYYMFAETRNDKCIQMLSADDLAHWKWEGSVDIRLADRTSPKGKPCGTPTVFIDGDKWFLFYERGDRGVWLATTADPSTRIWTNVHDEPVLSPGPAKYDAYQIALNQVIKYGGTYYGFYHGCGDATNRVWSVAIARSTDLLHWEKYRGNPLVDDNKSSGIVVPIGDRFRLYTMHNQVDVFEPAERGAVPSVTPARKSAADTGDRPPATPAIRP